MVKCFTVFFISRVFMNSKLSAMPYGTSHSKRMILSPSKNLFSLEFYGCL